MPNVPLETKAAVVDDSFVGVAVPLALECATEALDMGSIAVCEGIAEVEVDLATRAGWGGLFGVAGRAAVCTVSTIVDCCCKRFWRS